MAALREMVAAGGALSNDSPGVAFYGISAACVVISQAIRSRFAGPLARGFPLGWRLASLFPALPLRAGCCTGLAAAVEPASLSR